jgi:hypothetical protein
MVLRSDVIVMFLLFALLCVFSIAYFWTPGVMIKHIIASFSSITTQRPCDLKPRRLYPFCFSILAIFKNEAEYIAEWLEYHWLVGVERFWLVDNESNDNISAVLAPYVAIGVIERRHIRGRWRQVMTYNIYLQQMRETTQWVAIIDIDEFIVPIGTHCVPDILRQFEDKAGLDISWLNYGYSGIMTKESGLVIERFRNHTEPTFTKNLHTKSILNPRLVKTTDVHRAMYVNNLTSRHLCEPNDLPCHTMLRINHYFTKSYEAWLVKVKRGRGTTRDSYRISVIDLSQDVVTNDTTMDWYIPRVKANLISRYENAPPYVEPVKPTPPPFHPFLPLFDPPLRHFVPPTQRRRRRDNLHSRCPFSFSRRRTPRPFASWLTRWQRFLK